MPSQCGTPFEELVTFVEQGASKVTPRTRLHLESGCTECTEEVHWMNRVFDTLRSSRLERAPAALIESAISLFDQYPMPRVSPAREVIARLIWDGRDQMQLATARGQTGPGFQLLYRAEQMDIDLWCENRAEAQWLVTGQALPFDSEAMPPQLEVTVLPIGISVKTDDRGEFHLHNLPSGTYDFHLFATPVEVIVPGVILR